MILSSTAKASVYSSNNTEGSVNMTIDDADKDILMQILSEGLYKDPVGSIIREWASNALDSHVEANVSEPIVVKLGHDSRGSAWFTVQDFGVGISPERLENVVSKYAASTKRETNTLLGAYGLGFKSGLSYSDSFLFETNYNGVKYHYIMYKGEDGTKIDLLSHCPTEDRNGTIMKIAIKNTSDYFLFVSKVCEQLAYFENVYIDCEDIDNEEVSIFKGDLYKFSTLLPSQVKNLHLCLDNVYYPIDFNKLGIDVINCPIGLNFNIGEGLEPIPSREDIKYNPNSKKIIIERIKEVAQLLLERFGGDEKVLKTHDIDNYLREVNARSMYITLDEGNDLTSVDIAHLCKFIGAKSKIKLEGIDLLQPKEIEHLRNQILSNYVRKGSVSKDSFKKEELALYLSHEDCRRSKMWGKKIVIIEEALTPIQIDYFKWLGGDYQFYMKAYERVLKRKYSEIRSYYSILSLKDHPKSEWRKRISEFQLLETAILQDCNAIYLKDVKFPEEFLAFRKEKFRKRASFAINKEEVNPRYLTRSYHKMVFKSNGAISIGNLRKVNKLTIYAHIDDKDNLEKYGFLKGGFNVNLAILVTRDLKRIKASNMTNWVSLEQYITGEVKPFGKIAAWALANRFKQTHSSLFHSFNLYCGLSDKIDNAIKVINTNATADERYYYASSNILDSIIKKSIELQLIDQELLSSMKYLEEVFPKLQFLRNVSASSNHDIKIVKQAVTDVLKYNKVKLNLEQYTSVIKGELPQINTDDEVNDEDNDLAEFENLLNEEAEDQMASVVVVENEGEDQILETEEDETNENTENQ